MSDFGMVSVPQCCTPLTGVGSERVLFSGPIPQSLSAPFNRSRGFPPGSLDRDKHPQLLLWQYRDIARNGISRPRADGFALYTLASGGNTGFKAFCRGAKFQPKSISSAPCSRYSVVDHPDQSLWT